MASISRTVLEDYRASLESCKLEAPGTLNNPIFPKPLATVILLVGCMDLMCTQSFHKQNNTVCVLCDSSFHLAHVFKFTHVTPCVRIPFLYKVQ